MVEVKSEGGGGSAQRRPLVMIAIAAAVVVAAAVAWYLLTTWGGGSIGPPPTPTQAITVPQEVQIVFNDLKSCGQPDCVCATPDPFPGLRGGTVRWVNMTSAKVTVTPTTSGAFTGSNTHTVGGVAGVVFVIPGQPVSVTVASFLPVGVPEQLILTLEGDLKLCEGTQGPRMEIDN